MDTTVVIPALYMLTGRNASGTDASVWYLLDWGQITRSVKSLQVRTAKAVKVYLCHTAAPPKRKLGGRSEWRSRMR